MLRLGRSLKCETWGDVGQMETGILLQMELASDPKHRRLVSPLGFEVEMERCPQVQQVTAVVHAQGGSNGYAECPADNVNRFQHMTWTLPTCRRELRATDHE